MHYTVGIYELLKTTPLNKKWQFKSRIVDLYRKVLQIGPTSPSVYADICRDQGLVRAGNSDVRF